MCALHLDENAMYYDQGPEAKSRGIFLGTVLFGHLEYVLPPRCFTSAAAMVCHAMYKPCVEVKDVVTNEIHWAPSLVCKSTCQRHRAVWNDCMAKLNDDPKAKKYMKQRWTRRWRNGVP